MSDLADKIRELPIKHSLDCLGYPDCDGDLVSEPHSEKCLEMSACVSREAVLGLVAEPLMVTSESVEEEIKLHAADFTYGAPLPMPLQYSIAFHAANCPRCAFLAARAAAERQMKRGSGT